MGRGNLSGGNHQLTVGGAEKRVAEIFSDADEERARQRILDLLDAETTVRVRSVEGEQITYKRVPDNPVRLAAAVKVMEYRRGKPRQSVEVASVPPGGRQPLTAARLAAEVRNNPALVDEFISLLKPAQVDNPQVVEAVPSDLPPEKESEGRQREAPLSASMLPKQAAQATERPDAGTIPSPTPPPVSQPPANPTP